MSKFSIVNIGYGNIVMTNRIIAVTHPESAPIKRLITEAREKGKLIDATQGRRTRAVISVDEGIVILSSISPETIANRICGKISNEENIALLTEEV